MNNLLRLVVCTVFIGLISGCEPEPVEKTVWDDQIKTMDRARAVEDTLTQRADQFAKDFEGIDKDNDEQDPQR